MTDVYNTWKKRGDEGPKAPLVLRAIYNAQSKDSDISQGIVNQGVLKQRETTGTIVIPSEGKGGKKKHNKALSWSSEHRPNCVFL